MLSNTFERSPLYKFLIVLFVLAIAASSAIPNYLGGNWFLIKVPELSHLQQLKQIQQGLTLPGWHTLEQKVVEIGGHKWSFQPITSQPDASQPSLSASADPSSLQKEVLLLLRPQTGQRDLPEVDWMDIDGWMNGNGARGWTTDSQQLLQFLVQTPTLSSEKNHSPMQVKARFLRGWTEQGTYAVLQWYAWSNGGHADPNCWFWADQLSQLRDRRHTPWVAVSILIPIEPLGDIASVRSRAEAIAQTVQSTLIKDVSGFSSNSPKISKTPTPTSHF